MSGAAYVGMSTLPKGLGIAFAVFDSSLLTHEPQCYCLSQATADRIAEALSAAASVRFLREERARAVLAALDASPWFADHPRTREAIARAILAALPIEWDEYDTGPRR